MAQLMRVNMTSRQLAAGGAAIATLLAYLKTRREKIAGKRFAYLITHWYPLTNGNAANPHCILESEQREATS